MHDRLKTQDPAVAAQLTRLDWPARAGTCRKLAQQAGNEIRGRRISGLSSEPPAQGIAAARRRQCRPCLHLQAILVRDIQQIFVCQFIQTDKRFLGPPCAAGERRFTLGECPVQRRPHLKAESVAGKARIIIAFIMNVPQSMPTRVGLNLCTRPRQPRAQPTQAISTRDCRHASQPCHAGTAKGLEQQGFGLVTPVVRQQNGRCALLQRHGPQGTVARLPCPSLNAFARNGSRLQPAGAETNRPTASRPSPTLDLAMLQPRIGIRAQTVMNMQRQDRDCHPFAASQSGMQKCR